MENILYITNIADYKKYNEPKYTRIYFGNEYCAELIPSLSSLKTMLLLTKNNKQALTFLTPFCTNSGLKLISRSLRILPKQTEVVFNDWGVLSLIKEHNLAPILGRQLVEVKSDPRIKNLKESYYRTTNLQEHLQAFLVKNNIKRIELDNVHQGYDINLKKGISTSLYYPYVVCSITRKCNFANISKKSSKNIVVQSCSKECLNTTLPATINNKKIFFAANAQYYLNDKIPQDKLNKWRVSRMIYMPEFPA